MERGDLDDLPGAGQPLQLDDDSHVPEHLRAGYRLLRNSGHLPPELELLGELRNVERLITEATRAEATDELSQRASRLRLLLNERGHGAMTNPDYGLRVSRQLSGDR